MVITSDLIKVSILEIILLAILFLFYKYKKRSWIKNALLNFKFGIRKPLLTIILPMLISLFMVFSYILFFKRIVAYNVYLPILFFSGVILGPIFEEVLLRGVFLGCFIRLSENLNANLSKIIFISLGFLLQLFLFVFGHMRFGGGEILILIFSGFLFSLLFLIYKRNIIPSIIAHSTYNLFVILINI